MKPKTKYQKLIVNTGNELENITIEHTNYAKDKLFKFFGFKTKSKGVTCMECGCVFNTENKKCNCPKCNKNLNIITTTKRKEKSRGYLSVLNVKNNFQIIRYIQVDKTCNKGKKAEYSFNEVQRIFIDEKSKVSVTAIQRTIMSWDKHYILGTEMEYRNYNYGHDLTSKAYPSKRILPILKRNGFKNSNHSFDLIYLFTSLLTDNKFETLFKLRNKSYVYTYSGNKDLYNQLIICARNNYVPSDSTLWEDYIQLLKFMNKDINNSYYVCPENLKKEHNKYVLLKRKKDLEIELKDQKSKIDFFYKEKSKYFDIKLSKGEILIETLRSIEEYEKEGLALNHCVFTSEYYCKSKSIVLSAKVKGERTETIELSLDDFKVIQSRGHDNDDTKYHNEIINLVNKNSHKFKMQK